MDPELTLQIPGLLAWKSQVGSSVQQRFKCSRSDTGAHSRTRMELSVPLRLLRSRRQSKGSAPPGEERRGEELPPPLVLLLRLYRSCASTTNKASIKEEQLVRGSISALASGFPVFLGVRCASEFALWDFRRYDELILFLGLQSALSAFNATYYYSLISPSQMCKLVQTFTLDLNTQRVGRRRHVGSGRNPPGITNVRKADAILLVPISFLFKHQPFPVQQRDSSVTRLRKLKMGRIERWGSASATHIYKCLHIFVRLHTHIHGPISVGI